MKISGFTILRNGHTFDYPYVESIRSLLPLVDEMVVAVDPGSPGDETIATLKAHFGADPKVRILETHWDWNNPEKRKGGRILSEETNRAAQQCSGDWLVYLQADEVLHESATPLLRATFLKCLDDEKVEALVFPYLHLYGNYSTVQQTRSAYRREVRAFKRSSGAVSVGDAQSFRKSDGTKLRALLVNTPVYHYGWVRKPEAMREKTVFMDRLYHADAGDQGATGDNYRYKRFWGLREFRDAHPRVMWDRISKQNWKWHWQREPLVWSWRKDLKKVISDVIEHFTGWRPFEYRAYRRVDASRHPRVAVVVTTYNDPRALGIHLESLKAQTYRAFDVLVADDGSTDGTRALIDAYRPLLAGRGVRLVHFWHPDEGYRKSEINNNVFASLTADRHPITVCLDGDTFVHRKFLMDHVRHHRGPGPTLFMGRRLDLGPELTRSLKPSNLSGWGWWRSLGKAVLRNDTDRPLRAVRIAPAPLRHWLGRDRVRDLLGSNFSISTRLLHSINGYNESYRSYWGEDGDLYVRARNMGSRLMGSKNIAIQYHMDHPRREPTPEHQRRYAEILVTHDYVRCEQGISQRRSFQNLNA